MSLSLRVAFLAALLATLPAWNANANSVGFDQTTYTTWNGQLVFALVYDYTDFPMATGGLNLLYDAGSLEFVSYSPLPLDGFSWNGAGNAEQPGVISGLGHGTKLFSGLSGAGQFGTFVFNVFSTSAGVPECGGFQLCLVPGEFTQFVSLAGELLDPDDILGSANASVVAVPLPAPFVLF